MQGNADCGVMQETKLIDRIYMRDSSGFQVTATAAPRTHYGGVTFFYREAEHFAIEELRLYGPNFIRLKLVTGRRRWHIVWCYIPPPPSDTITIEEFVATIRDQPYGDELLAAGNLNADLEYSEGRLRSEAIADKPVAAGILDMGLNTLQLCNPWLKYRCSWRIQRYGQEVRSWTEYIIGID